MSVDPAESRRTESRVVLRPIDDVRGSARYRREAARHLVQGCLEQCLAVPS